MTLGGLWALSPDLPRIFREDFPGLPLASVLGSASLEATLHRVGDVFCFHRRLDEQPHEHALLGLALVILLYNVAMLTALLPGLRLRWPQPGRHRPKRAISAPPAARRPDVLAAIGPTATPVMDRS